MSYEARRFGHVQYPVVPFMDGVPAAAEAFLQGPDCTESTRQLVELFREGAARYSEPGKILNHRALEIAIPWYQTNPNPDRRFRKYKPPHQNQFDPYLKHPLEVGLDLMGAHLPYDFSELEGCRGFDLPSHHDPYDPVVAAAGILHDGLEDSMGMNGIGLFQNEAMAREVVTTYLRLGARGAGDELPEEMVDRVWSIVWAVTKPSNELVGQLSPAILADPFVQMNISHMYEQQGGRTGRADLERKQAEEIAFNHTMLERTQDDEFSRIAAFAVKTTDRGHNTTTPGTSFAKLHQSFTLAVYARVYGLPSASALAAGLIMNGFSLGSEVGSPDQDPDQLNMLQQYRQEEYEMEQRKRDNDPPKITVLFSGESTPHPMTVRANQIPLITTSERRGSPYKQIDPAVQYLTQVSDPAFLGRLMDSATVVLGTDWTTNTYIGHRIESRLWKTLQRGRQIVYFEAEDAPTGKTAFMCRVTDGQPIGHDVIKDGSNLEPHVPESAIFAAHDGSIESTLGLFRELSPLAR